MEISRNRIKKAGAVASLGAGAVLLACAACCVPLFAPLLAWLGVAGLALMGPIGMGASAIGAVALVWMAAALRRRRSQSRDPRSPNVTCQGECGGKCNQGE